MPDGVVEYRCSSCTYQIPLLAPGPREAEACLECGANPTPEADAPGVDSTGLLNFLFCASCGRLIGRYWGMLKLTGL